MTHQPHTLPIVGWNDSIHNHRVKAPTKEESEKNRKRINKIPANEYASNILRGITSRVGKGKITLDPNYD